MPFMFKTVISDKAFVRGLHFWSLKVSETTVGELKIGVSCTKGESFLNAAFSDTDSGFAFYSPGTLRNGSNANGSKYGTKLLKNSIVDILLNMNKGTLSFRIDG